MFPSRSDAKTICSGLGTGVWVGVAVNAAAWVADGMVVGVFEEIRVGASVLVGGGEAVGEDVGDGVSVSVRSPIGIGVGVGEGMAVNVAVGSSVGLGISVGDGVRVGSALALSVALLLTAASVSCRSVMILGGPQATRKAQIANHDKPIEIQLRMASRFSFTLYHATGKAASGECPGNHIASGSDFPGSARRKSEPVACH